jgi:hypothetical protein
MTVEALARVMRMEPSFVSWLQQRYTEYCDQIQQVDDPTKVRWVQGRMQEIQQILDTMQKAVNSN